MFHGFTVASIGFGGTEAADGFDGLPVMEPTDLFEVGPKQTLLTTAQSHYLPDAPVVLFARATSTVWSLASNAMSFVSCRALDP